jgi:hypothetical protein
VFYKDYTLLKFPIEVWYFCRLNKHLFPNTITIDDVYQSLNFTGIYNQKVMADIYLDYYDPGWSNAFT